VRPKRTERRQVKFVNKLQSFAHSEPAPSIDWQR
jgi:hypothetical protein